MRKIILLTLILLPLMANGADWKTLQDRGHSKMQIDRQSITSSGDAKEVTIREVFSSPETISTGEKYNVREMYLKVKCAEKTSAIQKIVYYRDGTLLRTLQIPTERMQFLPMAADGVFSRAVCTK